MDNHGKSSYTSTVVHRKWFLKEATQSVGWKSPQCGEFILTMIGDEQNCACWYDDLSDGYDGYDQKWRHEDIWHLIIGPIQLSAVRCTGTNAWYNWCGFWLVYPVQISKYLEWVWKRKAISKGELIAWWNCRANFGAISCVAWNAISLPFGRWNKYKSVDTVQACLNKTQANQKHENVDLRNKKTRLS